MNVRMLPPKPDVHIALGIGIGIRVQGCRLSFYAYAGVHGDSMNLGSGLEPGERIGGLVRRINRTSIIHVGIDAGAPTLRNNIPFPILRQVCCCFLYLPR